jgi:hypothetical protein
MRVLMSGVILATLAALSGCVVVPYGAPRAYVAAPRVAIVAPAPYIAVRPYYHWH